MDLAAVIQEAVEEHAATINASRVAHGEPGEIRVHVHLGMRRLILSVPDEEPIVVPLPKLPRAA